MNERRENLLVRALDLLERHLAEPISLAELAQEACMSERQFYRDFKQAVGDTPANHQRMRRLTEAAKALVQSETTVLDVALRYDFHSAEVFTRAFTRAFWRTPKSFRQTGSAYSANQRTRFAPAMLELVQTSKLSAPDILQLPARHMLGLHTVQAHYGLRVDANLAQGERLAEQLQSQLHRIPHLLNGEQWNIAFRKSPHLLQHEIENLYAVELTQAPKASEEFNYYALPPQTYARFHHRGDKAFIEFTISMAFQWLGKSAYFLGDGPSMLHILPGPQFACELYIPVSRLLQPTLTWWQGYSSEYVMHIGGASTTR